MKFSRLHKATAPASQSAHRLRSLLRPRVLGVAVGLAALSGIGACAAQTDEPEQQEEASEPQRHRSAASKVIDAALEHGDLTVNQENVIQTIAADIQESKESRREMREQFRAIAAEVVRDGTTDSPAFEEALETAIGAMEQRIEINANAVKDVHFALEPDQRASVAAALREDIADRFERKHRKKGFSKIAAHLMLSATQLDKIHETRRQMEDPNQRVRPSREQIDELINAFETDAFPEVLDAMLLEKSELMRQHLAKAGEKTEAALGILSMQQRFLLAELIEDPSILKGDETEQQQAQN